MTPTDGDLFLAHSISKLTQMTAYLETCLLRLTPDQVWTRPNATQNSIGNLVLHLRGNVRQWIGSTLGGQPDVRNRAAEFAPSSQVAITQLLAELQTTIADALQILSSLPPEALPNRVTTQDGERAILEVIYQVVGHFQQHAGQIIYATKLITGQDLNFYAPPKKSA